MTSGTHKSKPIARAVPLWTAVLLGLTTVTQADYRVLHHFTGGANDGAGPLGGLIQSRSTLYGMTAHGGNQSKGVIFALDLPQTRLVPDPYPTVQAAIDAAQAGDVIQVAPGTYSENIALTGEDLVLRSVDPNDPNITAITIIEGNGTDPVARLQDRSSLCVVAGFTIRRGGTGIWCSGGQPGIRGCQVIENTGPGIELLSGAKPAIGNCIIAANSGLGIKMPSLAQLRGRTPISPVVVNCTITQNTEGGVSGGTPVLRNSIISLNGPQQTGPQISVQGSQVTYSCVQGGFTGTGNINLDPWFVCLGEWTDASDVNQPVPAWLPGDYHLQSRAGCWDPNSEAWVRDSLTSPCVDAGSPADSVGAEPDPTGGRIDMGAYGGTTQASRSPSVQFTETGQQLNPLAGTGVVLADLNGDGHLDAFVANQDSQSGSGHRVYFGDGHGHFSDSGQRLAGSDGKPVAGDINQDGRLEVVVNNTVWLNDGQGHLEASLDLIQCSDSTQFSTVELADLNGDGALDVFAFAWNTSRQTGVCRVCLNDGSGRLTETAQRLGQDCMASLAMGDVNGDGAIDAVTGGWNQGGTAFCTNRIWLNDGHGNLLDSGQLLYSGTEHIHGVSLGDVNGDGHLDLLLGMNASWRSGLILINDGTGHFTATQSVGGIWAQGVGLRDFDGDDLLDAFLGCGMVPNSPPSQVWLNDGHGAFRDSGVRLPNAITQGAAFGDINGDGKIDVMVPNTLYQQVGTGNYVPSGSPAQVWLNTTPALSLPHRSTTTE